VVKYRRLRGRESFASEPLAILVLCGAALGSPTGCTEDLQLPPANAISATGGRMRAGSGGEMGGEGGRGGVSPDDKDAGARDAATMYSCHYLNGVQQQTPQVIITLDRSGSMFKKYGTSTVTRLQSVQQALRGLLDTYSDSIHFGYVEFPVKTCTSGCCASTVIPPNPQTLSAIEKRWSCDLLPASCSQTTNDSPAAQALRESRWFYEDEDTWPASRHVVLLTDGEPSCAANTAHNDCALAVAEVGKLSGANKVSTRVFGLAEELRSSACLDMMATLGGNSSVGQLPASHKITLTGEQLITELENWFGTLSTESCSFRLPSTITPPQKLWIRYNHKTVPHDPNRDDGWEFDAPDAPSRVVFYGSYCERLRIAPVEETEFSLCLPASP
jgi:hypothetical protein